MIRNRLAEIMAIKGLKLSDIHNKTKIARTTIKQIYDNQSNSISFDVLDVMLFHLGVRPEDFFEYHPLVFDVSTSIDSHEKNTDHLTGRTTATFTLPSGEIVSTLIIDIVIDKIAENELEYFYSQGFNEGEESDTLPELSLAMSTFVRKKIIGSIDLEIEKYVKDALNLKGSKKRFRFKRNLAISNGIIAQNYWDNF